MAALPPRLPPSRPPLPRSPGSAALRWGHRLAQRPAPSSAREETPAVARQVLGTGGAVCGRAAPGDFPHTVRAAYAALALPAARRLQHFCFSPLSPQRCGQSRAAARVDGEGRSLTALTRRGERPGDLRCGRGLSAHPAPAPRCSRREKGVRVLPHRDTLKIHLFLMTRSHAALCLWIWWAMCVLLSCKAQDISPFR